MVRWREVRGRGGRSRLLGVSGGGEEEGEGEERGH